VLLYGFLGPNGAGKTRRSASSRAFSAPLEGGPFWAATTCTRTRSRPRRASASFRTDRSFDKLTGAEFLRFVARCTARRATRRARVTGLLDVFELTALKDELVEAYSTGCAKS